MSKIRFDEIVAKKITALNYAGLPSDTDLGGSSITPGAKGIGETYYVDPRNGNDEFTGFSAAEAKATSQAAIDLCVDRQMDRIIRMSGTETLATAILFNKSGVIYEAEDSGYARFPGGERFVAYGAHTDGPAAIITQPTRLVGVGFCGSQTAGASVEIDCEDAGGFPGAWNELINVRFTHWGIAKAYALLCKGGAETQVMNCQFDGLWTGYSQAAIGLEDSAAQGCWNYVFGGNRFYFIGAGKYCIQLASGCHFRQGLVQGNVNIGSAKFFNAASQLGDSVFMQNFTGGATDLGSYNEAVTDLQGDGFKFAGNFYSE